MPAAETTFSSPRELEERLWRFLAESATRRSIAAEQRQVVEERYAYRAGMARMFEWIRSRLAKEAALIKLVG